MHLGVVVGQVQGINTPRFSVIQWTPSNLHIHHKGPSVPSLSHRSHSKVLPVGGSISSFHWVLSCTGLQVCLFSRLLVFFGLCIVSFRQTHSLCLPPAFRLPVSLTCGSLLSPISLSFAPPGSSFLSPGRPYFLSRRLLPFPSRCPLTRHPLPRPVPSNSRKHS